MPRVEPAADIASEWAAIAARRAERAARAVADGLATSAQADDDARLCATIARHLLWPIGTDRLMAMAPAMVNHIADAAELFDRITKPRSTAGSQPISEPLRRAAINATFAVTETLASVHYAMVALRHIPAATPTLRWRIPITNEGQHHHG